MKERHDGNVPTRGRREKEAVETESMSEERRKKGRENESRRKTTNEQRKTKEGRPVKAKVV